jgi:hypothetical protein
MTPAIRRLLPVAALLLVACAVSSPADQAPTLALRGDGRLVELAVEAGPTAPPAGAIDRERAIDLASAQLASAPPVSPSDQTRLVHLTVRAADGGATLLPRRLVWLVPFRGVEFTTQLCA